MQWRSQEIYSHLEYIRGVFSSPHINSLSECEIMHVLIVQLVIGNYDGYDNYGEDKFVPDEENCGSVEIEEFSWEFRKARYFVLTVFASWTWLTH